MPNLVHRWDVSVEEAFVIQERLARRVKLSPLKAPPKRVAGAAYRQLDGGTVAVGLVLLTYPDLELLEEHAGRFDAPVPYQPGLVAFHAGPGILALLARLERKPDLLLCQGHGIAHPRGLGMAAHVGVLTSLPTAGCAGGILYGIPMGGIDADRGSRVPLLAPSGDTIGMLLRTRKGTHPVLVSCGYRVTLDEAVEAVLRTAPRFRIPEPIRLAQMLTRRFQPGGETETPLRSSGNGKRGGRR